MDIGGIFLTNGWDHTMRQSAAKHFNLNYDEMEERHEFINYVFEIANVTLDEYLDTVVFYKPREFSREGFKEFMFAQSKELPDMLAWTKQWKKKTNLPVFALSNESLEINNFRIRKFGLHEVFDGFISSCYVGLRKPDPHIYKLAMKIGSVSPEECIYFEDRQMQVTAAEKLGMNAIKHNSFLESKKILKKLNEHHGK